MFADIQGTVTNQHAALAQGRLARLARWASQAVRAWPTVPLKNFHICLKLFSNTKIDFRNRGAKTNFAARPDPALTKIDFRAQGAKINFSIRPGPARLLPKLIFAPGARKSILRPGPARSGPGRFNITSEYYYFSFSYISMILYFYIFIILMLH